MCETFANECILFDIPNKEAENANTELLSCMSERTSINIIMRKYFLLNEYKQKNSEKNIAIASNYYLKLIENHLKKDIEEFCRLPNCAFFKIEHMLLIMAEYVRYSQTRIVAQEAMNIILIPILQIRKKLIDAYNEMAINSQILVLVNNANIDTLSGNNWRTLLGAYLGFLVEVLRTVSSDKTRRFLNEVYVGDKKWTELVLSVLSFVLLQSGHGLDNFSFNLLTSKENSTDRIGNDHKYNILDDINVIVNCIRYFKQSLQFLKKNIDNTSGDKIRDYWQTSLEDLVQKLAVLYYPAKGILAKYLINGGYINENSSLTHTLTKSVLTLTEEFLLVEDKYMKLLTKEWSLFFIRTHYLNFIKTYSINGAKEKTKLEVAKLNLRCLWAIATNRDEDVSNNFFRMNCVALLVKEINLEYELSPGGNLYEEENTKSTMAERKKPRPKRTILNSPSKFRLKSLDRNSGVDNGKKDNPEVNQDKEPKISIASIKQQKEHMSKRDRSDNFKFPRACNKRLCFNLGGSIDFRKNKNAVSPEKLNLNVLDALSSNAKFKFKSPILKSTKQDRLLNMQASLKDGILKKYICPNSPVISCKKYLPPLQNTKIQTKTSNSFYPVMTPVPPVRRGVSPIVMNFKDIGRDINANTNKNMGNRKLSINTKIKIKERTNGNDKDLSVSFLVINSMRGRKNTISKKISNVEINARIPNKDENIGTLEENYNPKSTTDRYDEEHDNNIKKPEEEKESKNIESKSTKQASQIANIVAMNSFKVSKRPIIPKLSFQSLPKFLLESAKDLNADAGLKPHTESSINICGKFAKPKHRSIFDQDSEKSKTELFYNYRKNREIYKDDELHSLMVGLLMSLLVTPSRGILDDLYCSPRPYDENKLNILHLLHFHINHSMNASILPNLYSMVSKITPALSGQRLLKLLCKEYFNSTLYTEWRKIASGAYATVFNCDTQLSSPKTVAIKRLNFPRTIYENCIFYDAFNEIATLEKFRNNSSVTTLYDYGVDDQNYYLVMKRYAISLRDWRLSQSGPINDHLNQYLEIYGKILNTVKFIHSHKVIHYDLKCDNFMLDNGTETVVLGDFGVSKICLKDVNEIDTKPRGTECIKSPEMLKQSLGQKSDKTHVGTNCSSDIWSLGCLFYELITGKYLFSADDYGPFYMHLTDDSNELLTDENIKQLGNTRLISFLKFMLKRAPNERPDIDSVIAKFNTMKDILVNTKITINPFVCDQNEKLLEKSLNGCASIMESTLCYFSENNSETASSFVKVMKNLYYCGSQDFLKKNYTEYLHRFSITHVILEGDIPSLSVYFELYNLKPNLYQNDPVNIYNELPGIMDFCRKSILQNGKLLFVDSPDNFLKIALIAIVSLSLKADEYNVRTLLGIQSFRMDLPSEELGTLNKWVTFKMQINDYLKNYQRYSCLCGCCSFVLRAKAGRIYHCNCENSVGCSEHLNFLRTNYGIQWGQLVWGIFDSNEDFLIGPSGIGAIENPEAIRTILHSDSGMIQNSSIKNFACSSICKYEMWKLYECKICHMWIYAASEHHVALILNNPIGIIIYYD